MPTENQNVKPFKVNHETIKKLLIAIVLIFISFSFGHIVGRSGVSLKFEKAQGVTISRETPPDKNINFSLFWNIWDTVSGRYYDKSKINTQDMIYGAISGMVASIGDPYTVFLPPSENKLADEDLSGAFEGVGIQIGFKGTQLSVIAPLPNSPGERAGIKAGDYIVRIKDEGKKVDVGTSGISLPEAVKLIRGSAGTSVTLTLLRKDEAEPIEVTVKRERMNVPSVEVSFVGSGEKIARIKLSKFAQDTNGEWEKAVKEVVNKCEVPNDKCLVILDLRNNPGGYLQGAVDIAGEFLDMGSVVVTEDAANGTKDMTLKVDRIGKLTKVKLVVLVNEGSASASEILAGALRDIKRIKLIGDTTFGKGTIQEPIQLEGGAGIHITTAKWLTPSGTWVNETGLEPDVKISDDENTEDDEQLNEAIKLVESM